MLALTHPTAPSHRFVVIGIPLILALLTLVLMMPFLRPPTGSEALNGHDLLYQQYPLYSFIFDSLRNGDDLPLWYPYQFAGQSIVGNPQATIVYPPAWIMLPLGVPRGVGWLVGFHLWIAGWGMALFARRLGASKSGALAAGIVYEFSGLLVAHLNAGHLNYLMCAAWLPWMTVAYLWSVERPRWLLSALPGASVFGLAVLAGHPPMLYFGLLWLVALWLYVLVTHPAPGWKARLFTTMRPLLIILIVGSILGAALLLPVAELTGRSTRSEASLGFSNSYALPGAQLLTLLIPNLFGEPRQGYWGLPFYEELTAYVGILPLAALLLVRRRPASILLVAFAVVGLVVSLGIDGGLFPILYYLLPGYSLFRVPPRALYFVTVGGAGLTALLITDLQTMTPDERAAFLRPLVRWVLPLLTILLAVGAFVLSVYFNAYSGDENPPWRLFHSANVTALSALSVVATWLILRLWSSWRAVDTRWLVTLTILVLLVDVWRVSSPLVTVSAVDVPAMWQVMSRAAPASPDFRVMTVPDNVIWQAGAAYTRHLNASGYDPLISGDYQRLLDAAAGNPTTPVARLLGVHYVITDKPFEWSGLTGAESLALVHQEGDWRVYKSPDPLPRAFIVPTIQVIADDESARQQIASGDINPLETAVISEPATCSLSPAELENQGEQVARILAYSANTVEIAVSTSQPGLLVLTDRYDPNWTVQVDDQPADWVRTYTALRGVCVPSGEHRVRFEYQPRAFFAGLILSLAGWLALAVVGTVMLIQSLSLRRKKYQS